MEESQGKGCVKVEKGRVCGEGQQVFSLVMYTLCTMVRLCNSSMQVVCVRISSKQ